MRFRVISNASQIPTNATSEAYLLVDNWNDWWKFQTLYSLVIVDEQGDPHRIGGVKIGQFAMPEGQHRPELPEEFDRLDDRFFSLGQDDTYYVKLSNLGPIMREEILASLHDVARDLDLFDRALKEKVTGVSLLRSVAVTTVQGQFHRIANGGARLSKYEFKYEVPVEGPSVADPVHLDFVVEPESCPPTNIHVLIGRNGVGKTTVLNKMTRAIVDDRSATSDVGSFKSDTNDRLFANLVSVTFSAFDPFEPLPNRQDKSEGVQYSYVGLKYATKLKRGDPRPPKSPEALSKDFSQSVLACSQGDRANRWKRALIVLEVDPIFRAAEVASLAEFDPSGEDIKQEARDIFRRLSSGHKIVLLTITRLVETVHEKTLVILDEPEAHLHPPLLSAFVRALSDLLIDRNGVAIVATHSPVVLQEVPKSCVWKIQRSGSQVVAERPEIETFGENVGILTREIFGLEVTQSGFHKLLHVAVEAGPDFDAVVERFNGELGGEARAIIRGLFAAGD